MSDTLTRLEQQRSALLAELARLQDFRRGSISTVYRKCGRPQCHCSRPNDRGHGPSIRLTYKAEGKSRLETLATPAAVKKAEQEIAEFRRFQDWSQAFLEVNEKICHERPIGEPSATAQEKKLHKPSTKKSQGK